MGNALTFNALTGQFDLVSRPPDKVQSAPGEYTVLASVAVRDLVYVSGDKAVAVADNASMSTGPCWAIVLAKPTTTTATLALSGKIAGFSGLTPSEELFVGTSGGLASPGSLPTTGFIQRVGVAVSATEILFEPSEPVLL